MALLLGAFVVVIGVMGPIAGLNDMKWIFALILPTLALVFTTWLRANGRLRPKDFVRTMGWLLEGLSWRKGRGDGDPKARR